MAKPKPSTRHLEPRIHALITLVSLITLAVTAATASRGNFNGWEYSLFKLIYGLPDTFKPFFLAATELGSGWMILILSVFAVLKKIKGLAHKVLLNGAVTYIVAEYLKLIVNRPRPAAFYSSIHPRQNFVFGNGFPSGHTAMVTVLGFTILPYLPKKYFWVVPTAVVSVAFSRIYLGVHAPLDVIGGAALGLIIASFQHLWTSTKIKHKGLKKH